MTMPDLQTSDPNQVFIIHGRNIAARNAVEHFLRVLGLTPLGFTQVATSLGGMVFIGETVRAGIQRAQGIIALFTPDEMGSLRDEYNSADDAPSDRQRLQARPNVIFEAGLAYGLAPERTVLATMGANVALFSDLTGMHVVRLDNEPQSRAQLRAKLLAIGCNVDEKIDDWTDPARSGDFVAPVNQVLCVAQAPRKRTNRKGILQMVPSLKIQIAATAGLLGTVAVGAAVSRDTKTTTDLAAQWQPSTGAHRVDLAGTTLSNEGDFEEDCVRRPDGFALTVRTREGTGGGAFAGCCLTFEKPLSAKRASVSIETAHREVLLHAKFENGPTQEYLHNGGWSGSGRLQGVLRTLQDRGATKFCVMAVGPNSPAQNDITVTDLEVQ